MSQKELPYGVYLTLRDTGSVELAEAISAHVREGRLEYIGIGKEGKPTFLLTELGLKVSVAFLERQGVKHVH